LAQQVKGRRRHTLAYRAARALANAFTRAADEPSAAQPAPYPIQRHLSEPMRRMALQDRNADHLYALAGQSAALARTDPAADIVTRFWHDARALLR